MGMTSVTEPPRPAAQPSSSGSLKGVVAAPTAICTIDGQAGRLIYRGYTIEDLAQNACFEEVVYLLWNGELPNRAQLEEFRTRLGSSRGVPDQIYRDLRTVPGNAHPLAVLRSGVSLLAHHDPDAESMEAGPERAKAERPLGQLPGGVEGGARQPQPALPWLWPRGLQGVGSARAHPAEAGPRGRRVARRPRHRRDPGGGSAGRDRRTWAEPQRGLLQRRPLLLAG